MHARESVCKAVLGAGDVADEKNKERQVGSPAHELEV